MVSGMFGKENQFLQTAKNHRPQLSRPFSSISVKVPDPMAEGKALEECIDIMSAHQQNCVKTGKYLEAEMAKKKLAKYNQQLEKQRRLMLISGYHDQKKAIDQAHANQIEQFNEYWDSKLFEYQAEAEKQETQTMERHQDEIKEFEAEIEKSLGVRQRESAEVINLRLIEENLARQENYIEAHKVKKQILKLEDSEFEKWSLTRNHKIRNLLLQLRTKQENQISALRQRIEQGFQEQKKFRNSEYQRLVQKYNNLLRQLQAQHHQELIRYDKAVRLQQSTPGLANRSHNASFNRSMQHRD